MQSFWAWAGFLLAAYSVVGNDSVQTLGTFIASNEKRFRWQVLWLSASLVLISALVWSWVIYGGDISFGRLNQIPHQPVMWYHACAPLVLLALTRLGIPVSTSFLVLSTFASTVILEKMLIKSMMGYGVSAFISYLLWVVLSRFLDEKKDPVQAHHVSFWRVLQWLSTGFLWFTWLSHDLANISVYLPRQLTVTELMIVLSTLVLLLGYIFWDHGGKIQGIVINKTGTRFVRSATIIDLVYAAILLYFKEYSDIPMSTTWVFVGILTGRELAICTVNEKYKVGNVFPIIGRDFFKMMLGLIISVTFVLTLNSV
ncbi:MAG: hypothetical protein CMF48_03130 [Legionellales bacterium]|nr:hypothetical protein [Legionellales bacterium]